MTLPKTGKKVRRPNPRRSLNAEGQVLLMLDKLADKGALLPGGFFDRGVIEDWYVRTYFAERDENEDDDLLSVYFPIIKPNPNPVHKTPLTLMMGDDVEKVFSPRRWYDTSPRFRKHMLLYGVKGDPDTHRPLTTWIGRDMIDTSRSTGKPLARLLHKSISDRLRRLVGRGNFGVWLNIEVSNKATYALHAHGLLYIKKPEYLVDGSEERETLIRELRLGSGDDLDPKREEREMTPSNWTRITPKDLNTGWIDYCRKARRGRLFRVSAKEPPTDIGERLEAGNHELRNQASAFYDRTRIMFTGLANEMIVDWTDEDWMRVTGSPNH